MSVPHGKNALLGDFISVEMMYRIAPPTKLPMPTMNIDFSILGDLFLCYLPMASFTWSDPSEIYEFVDFFDISCDSRFRNIEQTSYFYF